VGEPGGPDSEVFFLFDQVPHDTAFGAHCHPHCDCGRYIEIGNSVFMQYRRTIEGFEELPQRNVDFGGGLERLAMARLDSPDVFRIDVLWPLVERICALAGVVYEDQHTPLRIIADHARAVVFLAANGVVPTNTAQGYVMRRFARRALRQGHILGITDDVLGPLVAPVVDAYAEAYPELGERAEEITDVVQREESLFRRTLSRGVREFPKVAGSRLSGDAVFTLFDTYGFPPELSLEEAVAAGMPVEDAWRPRYDELMESQRERSRTSAQGLFKGGLADQSAATTELHTATHLLYQALRQVLGDHVVQRGSNVTAERLRFDFSHPTKMAPAELEQVEQVVNEAIARDWPMGFREMPPAQAFAGGALGAFGDKYGETVKVYTAGDPAGEWYSKEICGGPHVESTGVLGRFRILKEESSSAGVRRIRAVVEDSRSGG
jgi:alanyl-tRNA synthetase